MNKKHVTFIVGGLLGVVLGLADAFVYRGHGEVGMVVMGIVFCVAPPLGIVGLGALLLGKLWFGRKLKWVGIIALAGAEVLVVELLISVPLGFALQDHDVAEARAYCESLIDDLQAYRERTGSYPERFDEIQPERRQLPHLLRNTEFYSREREGDSFSFKFELPDSFPNTIHLYNSKDNNWTTYT